MEILKEYWIAVKGFEGLYICSNGGRIRSLPKLIPATKNRGAYWTKGQLLSDNSLSPDGYKICTLYTSKNKPKTKSVHHFIFYSFNPELKPKKGLEIDHIDNDKLNSRPDNLRLIPTRENSSKRSLQKPKSSKHTGVSKTKNGKFYACIRINGKSTSLGRFDDEEAAAQAYRDKLKTIL